MVETRKQFLIALLFLVLVQGVFAATLDEASLTYNGIPVRTLAPNETLRTDLSFVVSGPELEDCLPLGTTRCTAVIDASGLNPVMSDVRIDLADCERNGTRHTCETPITIKATDSSLEYRMFVLAPTTVLDASGSFPLTLDDTTPVLSNLETAFCKDGLCFVGSNAATQVTATFTDTLTAFDYKLVRFEVGRESGHATTCAGASCTGIVDSGPCTDGQNVNVRVTNFYGSFPSSEDAMNAVQNTLTISATCDAEEPELTSFEVYSEGALRQLFETAAPLHMTATLTDMEGGEINVFVNTTGVSDSDDAIDVSCDEINPGEFSCELQILNLIPGTHELTFIFSDGVNNIVVQEKTIVVMETYDPGDEIINFFETDINKLTPNVLNRVALDLAAKNNINYPLIVDYTIRKTRGTDAHIVHQDLQELECYWSGNQQNLTNLSNANAGLFRVDNSYILKPNADFGEANRMILNFQEDAGDLPDTVYAKCYYDLFVTEDGRVYSQPEREEISFVAKPIKLKNSVLGEPGAAFVHEIKRVEDGVDSSFGNALNKINRVAATADEICTIYGTLTQVNGVGAGLESMRSIPVVGQILAAVGDAIYTPTQYVFEFMADGGKGEKAVGSSISKKIKEQRENNKANGKDSSTGEPVPGLTSLQGGDSAGNFLSTACDWWSCATAEKEKAVNEGICGDINDWWQEPIMDVADKPATQEKIDSLEKSIEFYESEVSVNEQLFSSDYLGDIQDSDYVAKERKINEAKEGIEQLKQNPLLTHSASVADLTSQNLICAPDYSKSILASVGFYGGGVCLRGVLYNIGKWQAIDCGYLVCLKEQALTGQNINICKQAKKYKECAYVFDEISQVPYVNAFTNIFAGINAQVQDAPLEILMSVASTYCAGGTAAVKQFGQQIAEQMVFSYANVASGGKLGALKTILTLFNKLAKIESLVPILDFGSASGRPITTEPPGSDAALLVCHILEAVHHTSEFYALSQGVATGPSNFEMQYDICEAAKCNPGEDETCDYDASYLGWLGSDGEFYRRMLAGMQKSKGVNDPALSKLINDAIRSGKAIDSIMKEDFMESVKGNFQKDGSFDKAAYNDFKKSLKDYESYFNKLKKDDKLDDRVPYGEWVSEQEGKYGDVDQLTGAYGTDSWSSLDEEFTITYDANGNPSKIAHSNGKIIYSTTSGDCEGNCLSKSDAESIGEVGKRHEGSDIKSGTATISGEDVVDQAVKGSNCAANKETCASGTYEEQKNKLDKNSGAQENNLNLPDNFDFNEVLNSGAIDKLSTDYNNFMDSVTADNYDLSYPLCTGNNCQQFCGQDSCTYGDVRDFKRLNIETEIFILCREKHGTNCNGIRLDGQNLVDGEGNIIEKDFVNPQTRAEKVKNHMSEQAMKLVSTFVVKWLRDSGYLENLRLTGLGEWGAKRAAEAEKMFSPESWKQNLCSGYADVDVDDSPVWGLSTTDGPVLTFAAERRAVDENNTGEPYYIYSLTYYVRSGNMPDQYGVVQDDAPNGLEDGHNVRFLLKPGNVEYVNCTTNESVSSSGEHLEWGGAITAVSAECASWVDDREFTQLCLSFDKKFPDYTGQTLFCRDIQEDAFDRGTYTEGEVGIFG